MFLKQSITKHVLSVHTAKYLKNLVKNLNLTTKLGIFYVHY